MCLFGCLYVNSSYLRNISGPLERRRKHWDLDACVFVFCFYFDPWLRSYNKFSVFLCDCIWEKPDFFFDELYLPQIATTISPIQQVLTAIWLCHSSYWEAGSVFCTLNFEQCFHIWLLKLGHKRWYNLFLWWTPWNTTTMLWESLSYSCRKTHMTGNKVPAHSQ